MVNTVLLTFLILAFIILIINGYAVVVVGSIIGSILGIIIVTFVKVVFE